MQDPALGLVEPHKVHTGPLLKLVQVPLDIFPSLRCVNCTTQLGVFFKLAEGALDVAKSLMKMLKQHQSQYGPLRDTTCHQCAFGHRAIDFYLWMFCSISIALTEHLYPPSISKSQYC